MHNYSMHRIELRLRLVWRVSVRQHSLRMPKWKKVLDITVKCCIKRARMAAWKDTQRG